MQVTLIGAGLGTPATMTTAGREAVAHADCLIGAERLLEAFPNDGRPRLVSVRPEEIVSFLTRSSFEQAAVLVSGDIGFYSGAKRLRAALAALPEPPAVVGLPGISSVQYLCAQVGESWEDAHLVSLHGRDENAAGLVSVHAKTFFLTGGENGAAEICQTLDRAGLSHVQVYVGEKLSYPEERILCGSPAELAEETFAPLTAMLVLNPQPIEHPLTYGLSDDRFMRADVPMTKREARVVSLSALRLHPGDVVWDVGAGTGSVSVEAARLLPDGMVYAVEKSPAAAELLRLNRERFGLCSLRVVVGEAPVALETLPPPDAVFIGGSSGSLEKIVQLVLEQNRQARIVVNAIMLETAMTALECFTRAALPEVELVQLSAARAKEIGGGHMMMGQNPVFIISAGGVRDGR